MKFRNKRIVSLFLSIALLVGILVGSSPMVAFAEEAAKTLTIVHVNDVHGKVEENERDGEMGFAKFKAKLDELRVANPNLLLLNAGDTVHGTTLVNVTEGETMVSLMNLMGFDAMVPGNHDFNYGNERLLELKEMAEFPMIAANIIKEADKETVLEAYTIKEVDGLKIGIFGLGTDETKFKSHPKNTVGIKFIDPIETAKEIVKELKEKEVDMIIALVHLGIEGTTTATSKELAEKVEGIDLIVDGHSHEELNVPIGETLIVQAGSFVKNIGIVEIEVVDGKISKKTASLFTYEEAKELTPNPTIVEEIGKIKEINKPIVDVVIGKTAVDLVGERGLVRTKETNLGNLITDAMAKSTGADIAFTNGGGIRASISAGDIKVNDIITSFPFTNTLAVIEVTGAELMAALEHGVDKYPEEAGHFPHVSGMTYTFDPAKPVGERIEEVIVKGEALDLEKTYTLVTNDFMAAGGDGYSMFNGKAFVAEGGLLSDVLIDLVKEAVEINPVVEGRITVVNAPVEVPVEEPVVEPTPAPVDPTPAPTPAPTPTPTPVPVPTPVEQKYVVKAGDILWKIAKQFNTTWEKLAEYNNLKNPHLIFPNQVILVP